MPQTFGNLVGSHLVGRKGVADELRQLAARFNGATKTESFDCNVVLMRDLENSYHENAIRIYRGDVIGFVEREIADRLAPIMDAGHAITASFYSFADPKRPLIQFEWEGPAFIPKPAPPPYTPPPADDEEIPF